MFTGEYDLTMAAINAVVRLFREMDDEMYENWREKKDGGTSYLWSLQSY